MQRLATTSLITLASRTALLLGTMHAMTSGTCLLNEACADDAVITLDHPRMMVNSDVTIRANDAEDGVNIGAESEPTIIDWDPTFESDLLATADDGSGCSTSAWFQSTLNPVGIESATPEFMMWYSRHQSVSLFGSEPGSESTNSSNIMTSDRLRISVALTEPRRIVVDSGIDMRSHTEVLGQEYQGEGDGTWSWAHDLPAISDFGGAIQIRAKNWVSGEEGSFYPGECDGAGAECLQASNTLTTEGTHDFDGQNSLLLEPGFWFIEIVVSVDSSAVAENIHQAAFTSEFDLVSMVRFLETGSGGPAPYALPFSGTSLNPLAPSLAVEVRNGMEQVTSHAQGFREFARADLPEGTSSDVFMISSEPRMSEGGTLVQPFMAAARLEQGDASGSTPSTALVQGIFETELSLEDTINLDLELSRDALAEWDQAALQTWVYRIDGQQQWELLDPIRTSDQGLRIRYRLDAGGSYFIGGSPVLAAALQSDASNEHRTIAEQLELRSTYRLLGDIDGDGSIDGADLSQLLGSWGTDEFDADIDGNGVVDGQDLATLLGNWDA